ncbi:MAG: HlyC/CorC family transporter [Acholeplasmataceae bacterium]
MDRQDLTLTLVLIALIALSGFFSSTETAFSSVNRIKLKNLVQNGDKRAKRTLALAERFERVLITILIGNNIVNIAAASISTVLFVKHFGNPGVTLSTAVMTTLVLIFGEITPKAIAKESAESYSLAVTPILTVLIWILMPLYVIFAAIQRYMRRLIVLKKEATITEDELLTYVDEAEEEGQINANERQLIKSVIDFDDLKIEDIFTPRVHVIAVDRDDDNEKIIQAFRRTGYSRLPIYEEDMDHIVGIINYKDFYHQVIYEKEPLDRIIQPAVYVTEYMRISNLLALLRQNKSHIAIVKDEFGGTLGVVTMEDILEELVGDIWDEHDRVVEHIIKITEDTYRVRGDTNLDDFFELIGLETDFDFATVNGWVMDELDRIPEPGDAFRFENLEVTVTQANEKRVLEVTIRLLPVEQEAEDEDR